MDYENRILCFFDILGFGDIVKDKVIESNQIERLFNELELIIEDYKQDSIQITHFSDSIVISILKRTITPTQLRFIVEILIKLLESKLIARGAIVAGELIHNSKNIFGPGLVKAAYLEKNIAKYPRIILDESLDDKPLQTIGNAQVYYKDFFNNFAFVKRDKNDGHFYIDLIGEIEKRPNSNNLFEILNQLIETGLKHNEKKVATKYQWLREKMDEHLDLLSA